MRESTSCTITVTLYSRRLDGYTYCGYTYYGYTYYGCTYSARTYHISTYQVHDVPPLALQALLHFLYTDDFAQVRWLPPRICACTPALCMHTHATTASPADDVSQVQTVLREGAAEAEAAAATPATPAAASAAGAASAASAASASASSEPAEARAMGDDQRRMAQLQAVLAAAHKYQVARN